MKLVEGAGFTKAMDLNGYWMNGVGPYRNLLPPRFAALAERALKNSNVTFRDVDLGRFDQEVDMLWEVYNAAWEKNWGFVPMTRDELVHMAKDL